MASIKRENLCVTVTTSPTVGQTPITFLVGLNCYILALYLNIAVTAGSFIVPGVLGLVGAVLMVMHFRFTVPVVLLFLFLTLSLVGGHSEPDEFVEMFLIRLPSFVQIVVAIGCAHILLCAMTNYADAVRRTLRFWMLFITIGVVLEALIPGVREVSDAFRSWAFDGRFIYDAENRDLVDYGIVRPNLFSQEPSHVSKGFVVFATGWYLLASRRRLLTLLVCTAIVTLFLRSPFTLLAIPLALFLGRMASGRPLSRVVAAGVPILGLVAIGASQLFSARLENIASGEDTSFFTRYQGPFEVASATIQEYPIFGVGIGAKEAMWDAVYDSYLLYFSDATYLYKVYLDHFNNAFANSLMFFGVVGGIAFYWLVSWWFRSMNVPRTVSLSVVLLFFMLDGALEGIRMWSSIALILGCFVIAQQARNEPPLPELDDAPVRSSGRSGRQSVKQSRFARR